MYEISGLEHCYDSRMVLKTDKLRITEKSIIGLVGPNGSGKSTLLKLLAFAEKPTKGEIRFYGKPGFPFSDDVRFYISLLTQEPYLMRRSVYDNVDFGLKIRGDRKNNKDKIYQALSLVGLEAEKIANRQWYELSGGEAQRVALAARLVFKPKVLLLDEPTANVDADSAILIKEAALIAREKWGTTLVIAGHDWQWLYEIADTVWQLAKGRVLESGMENIVEGPWHFRDDGYCEKILSGGSKIILPRPANEYAVALLKLKIVPNYGKDQTGRENEHCLDGIISRLILDKSGENILASIVIGGITFTSRFSREDMKKNSLFPGQKITLAYKTDCVRWF